MPERRLSDTTIAVTPPKKAKLRVAAVAHSGLLPNPAVDDDPQPPWAANKAGAPALIAQLVRERPPQAGTRRSPAAVALTPRLAAI